MIEIVNDKERNLKNLKQIGTPKEENKIYVEHLVYAKIKENTYKDKRAFVLMGHTERMEGRYATFVEGVIPIREIEFHGNTPRWNNSTWSEIFREIKRLYEDMIIVGWALDIKGMSPKVTPELERVHREHFGGVHQVLFLLDTIEGEENFYMYKENKVVPKDGFYIYHRARQKDFIKQQEHYEQYEHYEQQERYEQQEQCGLKKEIIPVKVLEQKREKINFRKLQESQVDVELDIQQEKEKKNWQGGRYRQLINEKKKKKLTDDGNLGIAIAVAMLVFVIGVGVYEDRNSIFGTSNSIETNAPQEQQNNDAQTNQIQSGGIPANQTQSEDTPANQTQSGDVQTNQMQSEDAPANQTPSGDIQTNQVQSEDVQNNPKQSEDIQNNQVQTDEDIGTSQIQSGENTQTNQIQSNDGLQANSNQSGDAQTQSNNASSEPVNAEGESPGDSIPVDVISGAGPQE